MDGVWYAVAIDIEGCHTRKYPKVSRFTENYSREGYELFI